MDKIKKAFSKKNIEYFLIFECIFAFVILYITTSTSGGDLFFDIRSGKDLLKYGLDFKDHMSYLPDLKYYYHHLLHSLFMYFLYKKFNFIGIFIFFYFIYGLFGCLLFKTFENRTKDKFWSLVFTFFCLFWFRIFFVPRVQSITYILLLLEFLLIDKLYHEGNIKYSICLCLISFIFVNIHVLTWFMTLIIYLPFIFEFIVAWLKKYKNFNLFNNNIVIDYSNYFNRFIITFVLVILCSLISPYKTLQFVAPIKIYLNNYVYKNISEMAPTEFMNAIPAVILFALAFFVFFSKEKLKLSDICYLLGFALFSTFAWRNIGYVYLYFPIILFPLIYKLLKKNIKFKFKYNIKFNNIYIYLIGIIIATVVLVVGFNKKIDFKTFDYNTKKEYPEVVVSYIKENIDYKNVPIFTDFSEGAYFAFRDVPTFIDNRVEVYLSDFNGGHGVLDNYFIMLDDDYKKLLDQYSFKYLCVMDGSELGNKLIDDDDFKVIFSSGKYKLYMRVDSETGES